MVCPRLLTAVYTSNHVDGLILGILLEPIKIDLNASDTQMGFLVGLAFAIFYATLGPPITMLADRKNRRNIITAAASLLDVAREKNAGSLALNLS